MANIVAKHLDEASETQAMVETAAGKGSGRYRYYRDMWLDIADEFGLRCTPMFIPMSISVICFHVLLHDWRRRAIVSPAQSAAIRF